MNCEARAGGPIASWAPIQHRDLVFQPVPYGRILHESTACDLEPTSHAVVVAGAFDGLHAGHRKLIARALDDARRRGVPCVALTFDPDPSEVVGPQQPYGTRLLSIQDRIAGIFNMGVDYVLAVSFTPELCVFEPRRFLDEVLLACVRPVSVHVGTNFRFGHQGAGTVKTLEEAGAVAGFSLHAHELLSHGSSVVSATRIRTLLRQGGLDEANALLRRCHYVRGTVVHGRGEATSFGFPTANVRCDPHACMPSEGVYACYVVCEGFAWPAAANVGAPPTFSAPEPAFLEANLLGFSGDLYGKDVSVSFVKWLRASRVFDSIDELEQTVLGNIAWVEEHLGHERIEVRA